jgi:peptidoglycan hydrolase-like protein with peptidoglycan-binding domain
MSAKIVSRLPFICATFGTRAMQDLKLTRNKVGGLFGNGEIESQGFNTLQEIAPVVAGSAGGYGWMQWTGPRRKAYLAWAAALGLNPADDETNYRYMVHELLTIETAAYKALLACADDPSVAATVVCTKYLRPGVPHLDKRISAAKLAAGYLAIGLAPAAPIPPRPSLAPVGEPVAIPQGPKGDVAGSGPVGTAPAVQVEAGRWPEDSLSAFEIKAIQQRLLDLGFHVVGFVDGKWGKRTSAAITALQQQAANEGKAVTIDGHYGPQTRALLSSDEMKATVSPERASVTSKTLAKIGNPTVLAGRKITWSSIGSVLAGLGAFAVALAQGWQSTPPDMPFPFSLVLGFLPPWALPAIIVVFNLYNAAKATGLIGTAVDRVQQGIDNTGAPAAPVPSAPTTISLPFGLGKLFGQP